VPMEWGNRTMVRINNPGNPKKLATFDAAIVKWTLSNQTAQDSFYRVVAGGDDFFVATYRQMQHWECIPHGPCPEPTPSR
jgi:hypothetical protein